MVEEPVGPLVGVLVDPALPREMIVTDPLLEDTIDPALPRERIVRVLVDPALPREIILLEDSIEGLMLDILFLSGDYQGLHVENHLPL